MKYSDFINDKYFFAKLALKRNLYIVQRKSRLMKHFCCFFLLKFLVPAIIVMNMAESITQKSLKCCELVLEFQK